jgi:hypothetical protein
LRLKKLRGKFRNKNLLRLWHRFLWKIEKFFMNRFAVATLCGIAAGFTVGILVAAEEGKQLRKKICDAAGSWAERLVDSFAGNLESAPPTSENDVAVSADEILG